ncbi:hypothetical protein DYB37_007779 [Aphanomyces astaci]|uniref:Endoplasmic reticulum vesicle transporter C-terminal domain-containing protein n=1 Tax=Aphanomyces astaci TaxID=112090 RepID=A0A3R7C160_APHAT|nr:hypothetical protein DYB37_007779 [Aphanomyces astaci]
MFGRTFTRYIYNGPRNPESLLLFLDLFYRRLNPDGDLAEEVLPDFGTQLGLLATDDSDDDANEGCEVSGALSVQRVPGKLSFKAAAPDTSFDLSHINTSHHFSVTSNQYNASGDVPAAVVTYDVAPLVIELRPYHVPLFRFVTSFFAIVGGAYTILKVVDAGVFLALNSMQKKAQLGKLS